MKKVISFWFLILCTSTVFSQAYNSPESVEFDYANNRWFISNNGSGQIFTKSNSTGALSVFASNIPSGPLGLEILNDTLYVCDGATLKAYNINNGALVFNRNLGASFLNGITKDSSGNLYITDFGARRIVRFNTSERSFSTFVSNTVSTPNGIIFDEPNNRLVFVSWGSSAPIKAVDLTSAEVSTITNTSLGNCDGIAKDGAGNYYISSWSGGSKITMFDNAFSNATTVISAGLSNPADICYNLLTDTLAVPNSGPGNNVSFHFFGTPTQAKEKENPLNITVIPNPLNRKGEFQFETKSEGKTTLEIVDLKGIVVKTILLKNKKPGIHKIPIESLNLGVGTYLFNIRNGVYSGSQKVLIEP